MKAKHLYALLLLVEFYLIVISPPLSCAIFDREFSNSAFHQTTGKLIATKPTSPHIILRVELDDAPFTLPVSGLLYSQRMTFSSSENIGRWMGQELTITYITTIRNFSSQNVAVEIRAGNVLLFDRNDALNHIKTSRNWSTYWLLLFSQVVLFIFIYIKSVR
jgi:hypothetical protein